MGLTISQQSELHKLLILIEDENLYKWTFHFKLNTNNIFIV